ncbi:MAG TPA: alpha-amylase family glycosyl hydrolase, partial [Euzebyales bacterium]|nr:alpha-amylase family glycosyl hydrolase [Euzebyales bacterium]
EPERIAVYVDEYDAAALANGAWPNYCVGNHDNPRVSAHGPQRGRLALLLLLTLRGTPFFYYGDEIGMANVEVPPDLRDDRWTVPQHGMTRDSVRTPMQWDAGPNAGFCPPDVTPWLPVADDHEKVNVETERADRGSLLHLIRRLLELRRATPALTIGSYRRLPAAPAGCLAYVREHDGHRIAVVLNFGERPAVVDLTPELRGEVGRRGLNVLLSSGPRPASEGGAVVRLQARAGAVLELT